MFGDILGTFLEVDSLTVDTLGGHQSGRADLCSLVRFQARASCWNSPSSSIYPSIEGVLSVETRCQKKNGVPFGFGALVIV